MKGIRDIIVKGSIFAVLSAVFCMGGVPADTLLSTAHAATEITNTTTDWSGEMTLTGSNVTIESEVTLNGNTTLKVAEGKTLTINDSINCDDHTLTVAGPGTVTVTVSADHDGIRGNVKLTGGTLNANGSEGLDGIWGKVTITGGTLNVAGGAGGENRRDGGHGINGDVTLNSGTLIANGGIGSNRTDAQGGYGIFGNIEQTGGTLIATGGDCDVFPAIGILGNVALSGGTLTATGGNSHNTNACGIFGDVEQTGGTLIATGGNSFVYEGGQGIHGNVNLSDGTLKVTGGKKVGGGNGTAYYGNVIIADGKVFTIDGIQSFSGTLTDEQKAAIAGKFLTSYPAVIGETYYPIQDAMDAAADGDTVKLIKDVQTGSPVTIDKKITLDLNGHTIDRGLGKSGAVKDGYVIGIGESGNLTLSDSSDAKTGLITGGNNMNSGGGVYVVNGSFTMNGGTISGNKAGQGGGVYIGNKGTTLFKISGGAIKDNTGKKEESDIPQNVFLSDGKNIIISGKLADTTSIGITTEIKPAAGSLVRVTSGWKTHMDGEDPSSYFTSDDPEYMISLNGGEIVLDSPTAKTYAVIVENGLGDGEYEENATVTIKADDPADGKVFDKWTSEDGVEFADAASPETTFIMPTKDVEVTATYKDKKKPVDKVPATGDEKLASAADNFAPVPAGNKINKMQLDFSKVKESDVKPDALKMTVIKGSKLTTAAKIAEGGKVEKGGGVKVKVNKKKRIATITCKSTGWAKLPMEDGVTYTVNFTVDKPKGKKLTLTAGSGRVIKTIKELFNTDIDSGTLTATAKKNASRATVSADNTLVINPDGKDTIKVQYKYLNKKYKMSIKVK